MNPEYNNRTYAVIPTALANLYIESNFRNAHLSINGQFLIWDQNWDSTSKGNLKADSAIKLLSHKEALDLMETPAWKKKEPQ